MTLRLILTRHAKSSWSSLSQSDHERPLNSRGRASAPLIGKWIVENGFAPDLVLCSDAARTRETLVCLGYTHAPDIRFEPLLYHAGPAEMASILATARAQTVQMIGHNPGIAEFASDLLEQAPDHPDFDRYPTCATTVIEFDATSWATPGKGRCLGFVVPRDLGED